MTMTKKILLAGMLSMTTFAGIVSYANSERGDNFTQQTNNLEKRSQFMLKRIKGKLVLNNEQELKLKNVLKHFVNRREIIQKNRKNKFLSLLDTPTLDQEQALSLIENAGKHIKKNTPTMIAAIAKFTNSLSNKQRLELKHMIGSAHSSSRFMNPFKF